MYSKISESLIVTWIIQKKVIEIGHTSLQAAFTNIHAHLKTLGKKMQQ